MDPIGQTRAWLEQAIIGLDLCPFAARPHRQDTIRYVVVEDADFDAAIRAFIDEVELLVEQPEVSTTLVIFTDAFEEFAHLLDATATAEYLLEQAGLLGELQVVSFHPDYVFWGNEPDDQANFANRSPFPMLHILREDDVEDAIRKHPDVQGIPETNIERLQALSFDEIKRRWSLAEDE